MPKTRLLARALLLLLLALVAITMWRVHAQAWNPGFRRPLLSYDAAQYALAARELADHGRLATAFALPIELSRYPNPPWPLAVLQPGLVITEAALFRFTQSDAERAGPEAPFRLTWNREWLALIVPFLSFVLIGFAIALTTAHLLEFSGTPRALVWAGAFMAGVGFLFDPEAQHFATGGFTELPFTLGWLGAIAAFALRGARRLAPDPRFAFAIGLMLGAAGLFRGSMLWMAPIMALGLTWVSPGARVRTMLATLVGYALPLLPWWFYKWQMFGSPGWDLSAYSVWDQVGGHTWFSLFHLPELPELPHGAEALRVLATKAAGNLGDVAWALLSGLRGLWLIALVIWLALERERRELRAVALVVLVAVAVNVVVVAASVPVLRYLFPARVAMEACGLLAAWDLMARLTRFGADRAAITALRVGLGGVVLVGGLLQTSRGITEASAADDRRGLPMRMSLVSLAAMVRNEVPEGEVVMSNLGPTLAWFTGRPVVHLALTPTDVEACRRYLDVRHVILAFRDPSRAWPGWDEVMARPAEAPNRREWGVARVRQFETPDRFSIVWLELSSRSAAKLTPVGP